MPKKERFNILNEKFGIQSRFIDPMADDIKSRYSLDYDDIEKKLEQYHLLVGLFCKEPGCE